MRFVLGGLTCLAVPFAGRAVGAALLASELREVDDRFPKKGIRHERVSWSVEQLARGRAFVHFLETGACLRSFISNALWILAVTCSWLTSVHICCISGIIF